MEVEYKQTASDYFNAYKYIGKRLNASTKWRYLASFTGGAFGLFIALGTISISKFYDKYRFLELEELNYGLLSIVLGIVVLIVGLSIYRSKVKPLIFEENGLYLSPQKFKINQDYLFQRMGDNEYLYSWKYVKKVEKTHNYIYVFLDRGAALHIPRHAFESDEKFNAFYDALGSHTQYYIYE